LPVSAVEWNASANIAELPVKPAATYLQMAMHRFAKAAISTIREEDREAISLRRLRR